MYKRQAYSHGIAYDPFYAPNYFGRGRKLNVSGHFWQAVADFTMAIHLDSDNWTYWYYRATALNMKGHVEESIDDFKKCISMTAPQEHYPLADWLYTSNVELGRYKEAEESLNLVDASVEAPQMDYGYRRSVLLYKGIVKPEEFIDIPLLEKNVLHQNCLLYTSSAIPFSCLSSLFSSFHSHHNLKTEKKPAC